MMNDEHVKEAEKLTEALDALRRVRTDLERIVSESAIRRAEMDHKQDLIEKEHAAARRKQIAAWYKGGGL